MAPMANSVQTEAPPSAKQLVFVAMMATVVAVIVFLCGVLVGRGLPVQRMGAGDPLQSGLAGAVMFDTDVAVVDDGTSPLEDLSYHDELTEPAPSQAAPSAPELGDVQSADVSEVSEAPKAESALPLAPIAAAAEAPTPLPTEPDGYMVQGTALRDPAEAQAVADRLIGRGYSAVVVAPADGAPAGVFRVRVGPFENSTEAERSRERLETEEAFTPWVIQP